MRDLRSSSPPWSAGPHPTLLPKGEGTNSLSLWERAGVRANEQHHPSNQLNQLLAEIPALEQAQERLGRRLDAVRDRLAVLQFAGRDQRAELLQRLRPQVHVLADDEAAQGQPVGQQQLRLLERDRLAVVAADHSAQRD